MVGLIIATHGNTSEELVKSAEMFSGPLDGCRTTRYLRVTILKKGKKNWRHMSSSWMKETVFLS